MTKQDFLDVTPTNGYDWATQQLVVNSSKTEVDQFLRSLRKLQKMLYKSWALNLSLGELTGVLETAKVYLTDGENKVEN